MHVQPHTSKIPTIRKERPLQFLAGPQSIPHLQTSRKIHCLKHGPPSSPTEKYQDEETN